MKVTRATDMEFACSDRKFEEYSYLSFLTQTTIFKASFQMKIKDSIKVMSLYDATLTSPFSKTIKSICLFSRNFT